MDQREQPDQGDLRARALERIRDRERKRQQAKTSRPRGLHRLVIARIVLAVLALALWVAFF
jgi:hypothetical protein